MSINAIYPKLWVPKPVYHKVWLSFSRVSTRWNLSLD